MKRIISYILSVMFAVAFPLLGEAVKDDAMVNEFDKELRFYINGKLDETHTVKGEIVTSQAEHWFGNRLDGAWPYKGMLDEFVIYNRVLTADEIQKDMDSILSVSPSGKSATTWGMLKEF